MNKIIKKQLQSCRVADLPEIKDDTTHIVIPKYEQVRVTEDSTYVIKLAQSLITPNPDDMYNINWNKGSNPTFQYMFAEVGKVVGKNIFVYGVEYDIESNTPKQISWSGWLPLDRVEIIEEK